MSKGKSPWRYECPKCGSRSIRWIIDWKKDFEHDASCRYCYTQLDEDEVIDHVARARRGDA